MFYFEKRMLVACSMSAKLVDLLQTNRQQQIHNLRTNSSSSHLGLESFLQAKSLP